MRPEIKAALAELDSVDTREAMDLAARRMRSVNVPDRDSQLHHFAARLIGEAEARDKTGEERLSHGDVQAMINEMLGLAGLDMERAIEFERDQKRKELKAHDEEANKHINRARLEADSALRKLFETEKRQITSEQIEQMIDEATAPLLRQIGQYKAELKKIKKERKRGKPSAKDARFALAIEEITEARATRRSWSFGALARRALAEVKKAISRLRQATA